MPRKLGRKRKESYETGLMKDPKSMDFLERRINGLPTPALMMCDNDGFVDWVFEKRFKEKHPNPRYDSLLVRVQRRRMDELLREDRARFRDYKKETRRRDEYYRKLEAGELSEDDYDEELSDGVKRSQPIKDKKEKKKRKKN